MAYELIGPKDGAPVLLMHLSPIHISEPTSLLSIPYAVLCLKKKNRRN